MKIFVVGLGSMGKRRVRNLQALEVEDIIGFDRRADRRAEAEDQYGIPTVASFAEGMSADPYAVVVSTPAGQQMDYLQAALNSGKHCFNETNFVEDLSPLEDLAAQQGVVGVPSFTTRWNPAIRKLKQLVDSEETGRILAFRHHCGHYLPEWHPWEDYRDVYYAQSETGGGAREMVPFELQWITWILGDLAELTSLQDKLSDLDTEINDVYQVIVRLNGNILGNMQVDVISPVSYRNVMMFATDTVIVWDDSEPIRLYQRATESWTEMEVPRGTPHEGYKAPEEPYIAEIKAFLDAAAGTADYGYRYADYQHLVDLLARSEQKR